MITPGAAELSGSESSD